MDTFIADQEGFIKLISNSIRNAFDNTGLCYIAQDFAALSFS